MLTSLLRIARRWMTPTVALSSQYPPCVPEWCDVMAEHQSAIWWKVKPYTMTSVERVVTLCQSIAYLERRDIPGAIVECGVWKGGSVLAAALALESLGATNRELFLFDTFTGMTEPADIDVDWLGRHAREFLRLRTPEGELYRANASLDEVKQTLMQSRYPWEKLRFVAGKVENTIPKHAPGQIALLRLDTDWMASTRHELEHLYPRLADGGILIIDDYGHWQGAKHAVDGYFREHGIEADLRAIDFTGRLMVKKAATRTMARAA